MAKAGLVTCGCLRVYRCPPSCHNGRLSAIRRSGRAAFSRWVLLFRRRLVPAGAGGGNKTLTPISSACCCCGWINSPITAAMVCSLVAAATVVARSWALWDVAEPDGARDFKHGVDVLLVVVAACSDDDVGI